MDEHAPLISLKDISFGYTPGETVLDRVNFALHRGERLSLHGGNGAGKTTLFHIVLGLITPRSGSVELFGRRCAGEEDFREARRRIGLVFQDPDDQLFCPTVVEDVAFGPLNTGLKAAEALQRADATLEALGIGHLRDRVPYRLSGGEKRLVSVATVLAMNPDVLLLDEPTAGLDHRLTERLVRLISSYACQALVLISHDEGVSRALTTRRIELRDHRLQPPVPLPGIEG